MTAYAANDADAVKQIIIHTGIIHEIQLPVIPQPDALVISELLPINSPSNDIPQELPDAPIESPPSQPDIHEPRIEFELEPISDDDDNLIVDATSTTNRIVTTTESPERQTTSNLTLAERKQIHNRSCTLRQRRRLYEYKIVCRNIDSRFFIRKIKQMLDDNYIPFVAVNTVKSHTPGKSTLYIGVKDLTIVRRHQAFVQTLFDTRNYDRIYKENYNYPVNRRYR
jgi:hypothetical protein